MIIEPKIPNIQTNLYRPIDKMKIKITFVFF